MGVYPCKHCGALFVSVNMSQEAHATNCPLAAPACKTCGKPQAQDFVSATIYCSCIDHLNEVRARKGLPPIEAENASGAMHAKSEERNEVDGADAGGRPGERSPNTGSNPTEQEIADAYRREFPQCTLSNHERAFLAFIHVARSQGVGYGWMRQVVGLAWKVADPVGYIDDDRVVVLHAKSSAS